MYQYMKAYWYLFKVKIRNRIITITCFGYNCMEVENI
jgi:hypothetical protein